MERIKLPEGSEGSILWLGPKRGLISAYKLATSVPYMHNVWLYITNDGGLTWKNAWVGEYVGKIGDGFPVSSNVLGSVEDEANLAIDARGNVYMQRMDILIKCEPRGVDLWAPAAYIIPGWPSWNPTGALLFTKGSNTVVVVVEYGGQVWEFTSTNMGQWEKKKRREILTNEKYKWPRAGGIINGEPHWMYLTNWISDNSWTVGYGLVGPTYNWAYNFRFLPPGEGAKIGAVAMSVTPDGRVHVVYTHTTGKKIWYMVKVGVNWSEPVEIGTYAGHSVNNISDTSDSIITPGYQPNVVNRPYLTLQNDGFGLMVAWAEVIEPPSAGVNNRHVRLKRIYYDGAGWSTPEIIDDNIPLYNNTSGNESIFKLLGPFTGNNYGIHSLVIRDGANEDDVYLYPMTIPYQPYAPKDLAPANGLPSNDKERPLSWTFSDPVPGDSQTAYQIEIYRQSDSALIWDSGKVASTASTVNIPLVAGLVDAESYQWRVKTWDTADLEGPFSQLALFKISAKPVIAITNPSTDEVFNTDAPQITWTYTDADGNAQTSAKIEIIDADTQGVVYDSDWIYTSETSFTIANGILANSQDYIARVRVLDSDGIESIPAEETFTVEYIAPPMPSISTSADEYGGVNIIIEPGIPENNSWQEDRYKIYRREVTETEFTLLDALVSVKSKYISTFESIVNNWFNQGVATVKIQSESKEGTYSLGMGATGAGTARYTADILIEDLNNYNRLQFWVYTEDVTKFEAIEVRIGNNNVNYFTKSFPAELFTSGQWTSIQTSIDSMDTVGTPNRQFALYAALQIVNANAAIPAGDIRADQMRIMQNSYTYLDYTTAVNRQYIYGVSSFSDHTNLESPIVQTPAQSTRFTNQMINVQLVPVGNPGLAIAGFMDGTKPPTWTDKTDTQYYQPKGSTKPTVVVNGMQQYKEGSMEIRFFDNKFGGQELTAVDQLEAIKNFKPILFRSWWGRNYYISIDGEIDVVRKPGIGWYASFRFTEINQ